MINTHAEVSLEEIRSFYEEAFRELNRDSPVPAVDITYYPYVGLNQTIRVRDGRVRVPASQVSRRRGYHAGDVGSISVMTAAPVSARSIAYRGERSAAR